MVNSLFALFWKINQQQIHNIMYTIVIMLDDFIIIIYIERVGSLAYNYISALFFITNM